MWTLDLKPQVITHGKPGKCNRFIYVVEFHHSSFLIERHIFFNSRVYSSFLIHLSRVFPTYILRCCSGLSYEHYHMPYTLDEFNELKEL